MCGICGTISHNAVSQKETEVVGKMNALLVHRGPNSEGYFEGPHIKVGMRRLSIIDLAHGSQPVEA